MIAVRQLQYTYPSTHQPAISDLNFAVQPGEIFGFLGPSGAGKSTTQKVLIGLLKGYQGHVQVLGRDLASWRADYYERIGVSFETPNHFLKLTAVENLAYFAALYHTKPATPQTVLEMVGLGADGDTAVSQFSKGMKNRLNVARALLHNPQLLFLDEPTSGLDPVNAWRIKELIRQQQQLGKTIFLTTHNMAVADELCDRVAFIVDGQIRLVDSPKALKLKYGRSHVRLEYCHNNHVETREFALHNLGHNTEFLGLLRDYPVQTIHTQEATLEEIFIQVTGRELTQ